MTATARPMPLSSGPNAALLFPTLTPAQIGRIAAHGVTVPVARGDVLIESGEINVPFFVVNSGAIEVVRPSEWADLLIAVLAPGQFTGDMSMIHDRRALMRILDRLAPVGMATGMENGE